MRAILILLAMALTATGGTFKADLSRAFSEAQRAAFFRLVGAKELWTPADLPGVALWLDGKDGDTIWADTNATTAAEINDPVYRWDDKSPTEAYALSSDAGRRPIYTTNGLSVLDTGGTFASKRMTLVGASDLISGQSGATLFGVWRDANPTGDQNIHTVIYWSQESTAATWLGLYPRLINNLTQQSRRVAGESGATISVSQRSDVVLSVAFSDYAGGFLRVAYDGAAYTNTAFAEGAGTSSVLSSSLVQLFQYNSADSSRLPLNSHISEIILSQGSLSTAVRQRTEGYLAHKWGLTTNLPSDHPYKDDPPYK